MLGRFAEHHIQDMYDANEYMCIACDKGMFCPKHKIRKMNHVLKGTLGIGTVAFAKEINYKINVDESLLTQSQKDGELATDIFFLNCQAELLDKEHKMYGDRADAVEKKKLDAIKVEMADEDEDDDLEVRDN